MTVKAELRVLPWGNSLAVRIPSAVARQARIANGQAVTVEAIDGMVLVRPKGRLPQLTLTQKLKLFDLSVHGGELMADRPIGAELG